MTINETPKYRLDSKTHSWVRELSGNTRQEFAQAVANRAGMIPDNAIIIDETGKLIGYWLPKASYHNGLTPQLSAKFLGRSGLFFSDNRPGLEYAWIADRSEALCVAGQVAQ